MDQVVSLSQHHSALNSLVSNNPAFSQNWAHEIQSDLRQQRHSLEQLQGVNSNLGASINTHTSRLDEAAARVQLEHSERVVAIQNITNNVTNLEARVQFVSDSFNESVQVAIAPMTGRIDSIVGSHDELRQLVQSLSQSLSDVRTEFQAALNSQNGRIEAMDRTIQHQSGVITSLVSQLAEARSHLQTQVDGMQALTNTYAARLEDAESTCAQADVLLDSHASEIASLKGHNATVLHSIGELEGRIGGLGHPTAPAMVTCPAISVSSSLTNVKPNHFNPAKKEVSASDWLAHTEAVLQAASIPERDWVKTAIPYLTGVAATWALERTMNTTLLAGDWAFFSQQVSAQFEVGDKAQRARDSLASLRFRRGDDLVLFVAKVRMAFSSIGALSEAQKFEYVERCVAEDLVTLIRDSRAEDPGYTFEQFCSKCLAQYGLYKSANTQMATLYSLLPAKAHSGQNGQSSSSHRRPNRGSGGSRNTHAGKAGSSSKSGGGDGSKSSPSGSGAGTKSHSSAKSSTGSGSGSGKSCTHCGKPGHTYEYCYSRLGKEAALKKKKEAAAATSSSASKKRGEA